MLWGEIPSVWSTARWCSQGLVWPGTCLLMRSQGEHWYSTKPNVLAMPLLLHHQDIFPPVPVLFPWIIFCMHAHTHMYTHAHVHTHTHTEPPSVPRNLTVLQVTNTSVQLSWDPPVSNGGRDDLEYQLSYQRAGVPNNVTVYGRVSITLGQITGLRPFIQYVVMVSGENEVSV